MPFHDPLQIRDDIRLSGEVVRYHTWPHIRQQSVGEHSWQVARIILSIAPKYQHLLLPYAIVHDVGEIGVGDVPYPVKAQNPNLDKIFSELEETAIDELLKEWQIDVSIIALDKDLKTIFKLAEFIEMWEWGWAEQLRGNVFARLVAERCLIATNTHICMVESIDSEVAALAQNYVSTRWRKWNGHDRKG